MAQRSYGHTPSSSERATFYKWTWKKYKFEKIFDAEKYMGGGRGAIVNSALLPKDHKCHGMVQLMIQSNSF